MSVDVASLIFEIDSTQAVTARQRLEDLEKTGAKVDAVARRVKTASEMAGIGLEKNAAGATRAARAATEHAQAQSTVEKATERAERAATRAAEREAAGWARVEAAILKRNAAYRGDLAAQQMKDAERVAVAQERASSAAAAAAERAAAAQERASRDAAQAAEREAARQIAAQTKIEAALERRNAAYRGNVALTAMKAEAAAASSLEARIDRLMNSLDPTRAAQTRLNSELQEAASLYKMGAISASDYARAVSTLDSRMAVATRGQGGLSNAQVRGVATSKQLTYAGLNLSRQFTDIGVQLASQTPLYLVMIQQLPQIADVFASAKAEGVGFTAMLKGLLGPLAGLAGAVAMVSVVIGSAAAGFGLMNRELQKGFPDDITKGLNLTEEQLDRVKTKTVTTGDVFMATLDVMGKYLMTGPLGEGIGWLDKQWNAFLDNATSFAFEATATITGVFVGTYRTIVDNWRNFPAVIKDFFVMAMNAAIDEVQKLLNASIASFNQIKQAMSLFNPSLAAIPNIPEADLSRFKGQVTSAAEFAGKALRANVVGAIDEAREGMRKLGTEIGSGAFKRATDKALKQAGDPNKASKGAAAPRDQTDERTAQIEAMIQAALADELQARLGVTREIEARADLERQMARAQEAVKAAQLDRQAANIADDKGLTEAKKAELLGQIEIVRSINARAAAYREQAIEEAKVAARSREVFGLRQAQAEVQLRELASQEAIAKFDHERYGLARDRLKIEQTLEREALEQVTAANGATEYQIKIAQSLLNRLGAIQANEREAFRMQALDRAVGETTRAVQDIGDALREHDWGRVFTSLIKVVDQAIVAFATAKTSAERMSASGSLISAVGGAVGGKAGSAIGAIGSGFSAAGAAAGMAGSFGAIGGAIAGLAGPIGIAVAGFSLLSGILGDQKAKKRAKLEQEARDMENARAAALEEANRQAELQLRILELSGDEIGALTKRREAELATLKGASRALAEHVHALEDWVKAVDLAKDAVSKAQDDLRAAYEADKDRLNAIVAGVETARDRLNQAYQRERGVIEGTISSVRSLVDSLSAFRVEMDMMAAANDPSRQYGYASRQFATASNDNLIERGRAFAEASQSASATDLDFQRDLAAVRRRTDEASKTAQTQLTTAERQLLALDAMVIPLLGVNDNLTSVEEAIRGLTTAEQMALLATEELARLDAQVGALIAINSSVLSVAQAISNLNGAISALASAQASKPAEPTGATSQAVGLTGYVDKNADLAALYASGSGMAAGRTKEQFAAYHWERYGQAEGRTYTAFARGGDHMGGLRLVGEEGPELEATGPSRIYNARQTAQMLGGDTARLEALVETLTDKVEELTKLQRTDNFEIKRNTKDSADIMAKVTQGADTVRVKAA